MFFFFNDTATTEIYTLSLHDALPICNVGTPAMRQGGSSSRSVAGASRRSASQRASMRTTASLASSTGRSEEHTSELQSQSNLVCRLLLEKKKNIIIRAALHHRVLYHT